MSIKETIHLGIIHSDSVISALSSPLIFTRLLSFREEEAEGNESHRGCDARRCLLSVAERRSRRETDYLMEQISNKSISSLSN